MPAPAALRRKSITVGELASNCHLLYDPTTREGAVVDPGADADAILEAIEGLSLRISAILLTHAHIDHIGALAEVHRRHAEAPVYLHPLELPWLTDGSLNGAQWLGFPYEPFGGAIAYPETGVLHLLGRELKIIHSPGHSPGSVVILSPTDDLAAGGDVLFRGSIGRTDLPGGDSREMSRSLRRLAQELAPGTLFLPGHGPETTLAVELLENPYVKLAVGSSTPL